MGGREVREKKRSGAGASGCFWGELPVREGAVHGQLEAGAAGGHASALGVGFGQKATEGSGTS